MLKEEKIKRTLNILGIMELKVDIDFTHELSYLSLTVDGKICQFNY